MPEMVEDKDEPVNWQDAMDSECDSESDTDDEFQQQWAVGECLYSAMMLDDSCIPEEGIDRKWATGIQRA